MKEVLAKLPWLQEQLEGRAATGTGRLVVPGWEKGRKVCEDYLCGGVEVDSYGILACYAAMRLQEAVCERIVIVCDVREIAC